MKSVLKILTAVAFSILIVSCVTRPESTARYSVYVTDTAQYELLPPSAFEEDMDRFQNITGSFQGKVHIFGAYIKSSDEQVAITFFNQMGGSVGDLLYTGDSLEVTSHFTPPGTKFEYMMADFQFCYCKKEILAESLEATGLHFEVSEKDGIEIRKISDNDKLVIQVERDKNHTRLQNLLRQYSYDIMEGN